MPLRLRKKHFVTVDIIDERSFGDANSLYKS
jgi:hypothetical protein